MPAFVSAKQPSWLRTAGAKANRASKVSRFQLLFRTRKKPRASSTRLRTAARLQCLLRRHFGRPNSECLKINSASAGWCRFSASLRLQRLFRIGMPEKARAWATLESISERGAEVYAKAQTHYPLNVPERVVRATRSTWNRIRSTDSGAEAQPFVLREFSEPSRTRLNAG